jgi:dUTPase
MKIEKVEPVTFVEVAELSETNRGGNGFGSSGM